MKKAYMSPESDVLCFVSKEKLAASWDNVNPLAAGDTSSYVEIDLWEDTNPENKN